MILAKIIAGALAIVWDVESAFVGVTVGGADLNRGSGTCGIVATTANLTGCGRDLSDALVNLVVNGVHVLNGLLAGLAVTGSVRT